MKKAPDKIIFYDGDCGFCNRSVQFVLKYQKDTRIHFSAIQSAFSHELFNEENWKQPDLSTVYFLENGQLFEKSDAGIEVSKYLKFPFSLLYFFWIVPSFLRDKIYDGIAKRRHKLSKGFCLVPSQKNKKQFI